MNVMKSQFNFKSLCRPYAAAIRAKPKVGSLECRNDITNAYVRGGLESRFLGTQTVTRILRALKCTSEHVSLSNAEGNDWIMVACTKYFRMQRLRYQCHVAG